MAFIDDAITAILEREPIPDEPDITATSQEALRGPPVRPPARSDAKETPIEDVGEAEIRQFWVKDAVKAAEKKRLDEIAADVTFSENVRDKGKRFVLGASDIALSLPQFHAMAQKWVTDLAVDVPKDMDEDVREMSLYKMGDDARRFMHKYLPVDERLDHTFWSKVASGLGSTGGFLAVGALTSAATGGASIPAMVTTGAVGASAESVNIYERAKAGGASEEEALAAAAYGLPAGAIEAAPVVRILGRFNKATGGELGRGISTVLKQGAVGSVEEATQEWAQSTIGNAALRKAGVGEPKLMEDTLESGAVGGVVGFLANMATTALGLGRMRRRELLTEKGAKAVADVAPPVARKLGESQQPSRRDESVRELKELVPEAEVEKWSAADRKKMADLVREQEIGHARPIRSDEGQVPQARPVVEGGEAARGEDIQRIEEARRAERVQEGQEEVLTQGNLNRQVLEFAGKGGIASEAKKADLQPAFRHKETGEIFHDPRANVHLFETVPERYWVERDAIDGFPVSVVAAIEAGFVDSAGKFLTREQASQRVSEQLAGESAARPIGGATATRPAERVSDVGVSGIAGEGEAHRADVPRAGVRGQLEEVGQARAVEAPESRALTEMRTKNIREMFASGEQKIQAAQKAREASRMTVGEGVRQSLQYLIDTTKPAKRVVQKGKKAAAEFDESLNAAYMLDELFLIDNPGHVLINRIQDRVYKPLTDAGMDSLDIGEYLFLRRVINERNEIENPLGFTPEASKEQVESLRQRLGDQRFALLEQRVQEFHELVFSAAEQAVEAGVYNRAAFENTIVPNKGNYATFAVIKYLEDTIPAGLYQQVGTLRGVANPFHATIMKVLTLQRLNQVNAAKRVVRDTMLEGVGEDIEKAEIPRGHREPNRPAPQGKDYLVMLEDGKPEAHIVAAPIARAFKLHDVGGLARYGNWLSSKVYKTFHPLYVTFQPGFLVANPFRDLRRTHINLGSLGSKLNRELRARLQAQGYTAAQAKQAASKQNVSLGQVLWAFLKSVPAAKRRAQGVHDELVERMLEEKALAIPYTEAAAETGEIVPVKMPGQSGLSKTEKMRRSQNAAVRGIGHVLNAIRTVGEIQETGSKMAAWKLLAERGVTGRERAYYVRKFAGTPDYKQKGLATSFTNALWMYSKVRWNGLQADLSLAANPKTAGAWWWRRMVWNLMPTTLTKLGMYGFFGPYVAHVLSMVPSYFLDDYDVVPLGTTDDGGEEKAVFLSIPMDDVGRLVKTVWSRMMDLAIEGAGGQTRQESVARIGSQLIGGMYGEAMPAFNPMIDLASKWGQFAMGKNPYDSYFNQPVVPRAEWEAGGWDANKKMLSWTVDKFGVVSAFSHAVTGPLVGSPFEPGEESTIETKVRSVPGLSRLVRISDRGVDEQRWAEIENADAERARFKLGLDPVSQRLTGERHRLNRQSTLKQLDVDEEARRALVNEWYGNSYLPLTENIRDAEDANRSEDAQRFRAELAESAQGVNAQTLERGQALYLTKVTMDLTANTTGKKRRDESIDEAVRRAKEAGLTYGQARRLLRTEWRRKRFKMDSAALRRRYVRLRQRLAE
jgi:hypothetical protein